MISTAKTGRSDLFQQAMGSFETALRTVPSRGIHAAMR